MKKSKRSKPFDKYLFYQLAVQDNPQTADFIENAFRREYRRFPRALREDFCGTFALCFEWVTRGKDYSAIGVDTASEPLRYGRSHYLDELEERQKKRLQIRQENVLTTRAPKVDVIAALNFSFYILKQRQELLHYFKRCYQGLNAEGMLVLDAFGGPETHTPIEDVSREKGFTYYWEQENFDPVTHFAKFHIHFKLPGEKKRERVFSYDWRMWILPELKDILLEAGFKKVVVYSDEEPHGYYRPTKKMTPVPDAWIVYIIGVK